MQHALWDERGAAPVIDGSPRTYKLGIPLGKLATAQDIAEAVVFLVSDQAGHITMHDLYVDGGRHAARLTGPLRTASHGRLR